MIPFYKNHLGFTMELKTPSSFKSTGLLQPWQTLCKIFSKCLTTRITGWDQPPLKIMKMMYCFINNIYVDYAELLSEGIYDSLLHLTSLIPYPRFTKIIIGHYMTNFLEMSRRARDKYYNLKDDDLMKNIFNSGRYKDKVGMKIPDWMISKEMKQTKHYRMYVEVFGIDVPLTQSQPTESTQGMHRTPSASKSPNPKVDAAESIPTIDKADELILQDTLQVSLVKHKSRQEKEARENAALVEEHLASVEFKKIVEGQENVIDDGSILRNAEHNNLGTRLEPRSDKESPEVEFTDVVIPVNVYDTEEEEDEITDEVYKLKRSGKGKNIEESRITTFPTPIRSPRIHIDLELQGRYGYLFEHLRAKLMPRKSFVTLADHLHKPMADSLPTMVDKHIKEQVQQQEQGPSTSGNQEQVDYDFWTDSYALDDDEIPTKKVSQDIIKEVSLNIDEAKLKKIADEMLRQRCTSEDEHQHHIDQTKNFLKSDINPHAKIFYIRKQKEPGKPKEVIYSNSKIIQIIKTYWELGHEHKFIREIITRRSNECIVSITEPDFKNLNKNDIEDMYLLIMNGKKVNFTAPTISFLEIEKHEMFSIIYEPVHGIIDKNIKKEKRVMRHLEIHKFCDATRNRVLEGLKSYNNDVKYGYIQRELTKDEVEYLKLFEEDIEDRLKYRRQMRR
nr:hypothetical protein [Tanacetum cinerariifolium]